MGREINRYTMLGEYDEMFIALLKTWMINHDIDHNDSENTVIICRSYESWV